MCTDDWCSVNDIESGATRAIEKSKAIVTEIYEYGESGNPLVLQRFDDLSDTLCRAADPAECIRQVRNHTI